MRVQCMWLGILSVMLGQCSGWIDCFRLFSKKNLWSSPLWGCRLVLHKFLHLASGLSSELGGSKIKQIEGHFTSKIPYTFGKIPFVF